MTKYDLSMIRGDTFSFDVELEDVENVQEIKFTVKRQASDRTPQIQKILGDGISLFDEGVYRVRIAPADTAEIKAGVWVYDLEVTVGEDVYTVLMGTFTIIQDIG